MTKAKRSPRTLIDVLRGLMPAPVREDLSEEGVLLTAGDPGLVAVRVSDHGVSVSVFGIRWDGPHTPIPDHRQLCYLAWEELPAEEPEQAVVVDSLVRAAVVIRRARFRECRYCQRSMPPVCQGCAERHLGVVH